MRFIYLLVFSGKYIKIFPLIVGTQLKCECMFDLKDILKLNVLFLFIYLFIYLFAFSRAAHMAYRGSQARGLIGGVVPGLHPSHSNAGSEPHL